MEEDEDSDAGSSKPIIRLFSSASSTSIDSVKLNPTKVQSKPKILQVDEWVKRNGKISPKINHGIELNNSYETRRMSPWKMR